VLDWKLVDVWPISKLDSDMSSKDEELPNAGEEIPTR
jgi:hypothetical protein